MPDESCRSCGGTLVNYSKCVECNQVNQLICKNCGLLTSEQFHSLCMYFIENVATSVPGIKSGNYNLVALT